MKFEYRFLQLTNECTSHKNSADYKEDQLNSLGSDGWEVCGMAVISFNIVIIIKRQQQRTKGTWVMGALIFVGIVCCFVACGFVGAAAVVNTGKPRLSSHEIEEVLRRYHDEYGEFAYKRCADKIEEMLQP